MDNLINRENNIQFVVHLKYLSSHIANFLKRGNLYVVCDPTKIFKQSISTINDSLYNKKKQKKTTYKNIYIVSSYAMIYSP